ncbi:hypothetical protein BC940DRAFT_298123 [Gongronella butleri]|nr:hypothetical protein BC940DRAFT_298123 [Gongronella butleri]
MMNSEAPINAGHAFANAAEEYEDRDQWAKAIQAHENAAQQFQKALDYSQDNEADKTLRLLIATHTRKAKEIQRKWQKQQMEKTSATTTPAAHAGPMIHPADLDMQALMQALPAHDTNDHPAKRAFDASHHGIGESYALLSTGEEEEDAADPFNRFLKVVETLMDQLSNPVAFATAPLNEDDMPTPYQQRFLANDPLIPNDDGSNAMAESFFMVPDHPETKPSANTSASSSEHDNDHLQVENEHLKRQVDQLTRRLRSLEKTAEESHMLKSSILQFRNDVQRQAKRIMQSHDPASLRSSVAFGPLTGSAIHPTVQSYPRPPPLNANGASNAELVSRIKELEDENKRLKDQNEKQQLLMNKYRERWEKLKESAKKRRAQPIDSPSMASGPSTLTVDARPAYASPSRPPPGLLRTLAQQQPPSTYLPFATTSHHPASSSSSSSPTSASLARPT